MPRIITGIAPRVRTAVVYGAPDRLYAPDVDCRLLFLGEHLQPLLHAYEQVVRCFSVSKDRAELIRAIESSAAIRQFYDAHQNGKVSVVLRDSVYRQPGPIDDEKLLLKLSRAETSVSYPLPRCRLRALGYFWPLLRSNRTETEIESLLKINLGKDDADWASGLLALLTGSGFLDYDPQPPNDFLRAGTPASATFMGHTSILFQSERSAVLMDPLLLTDAGYARTAFGVQQIKLGAICCSHHHWDHCNIQTLMGFDKSTPVVIPRVEHPSAFNPPMTEMLRLLGFTDIREARLWEPIQIDDIELIPLPFHGEQDEPGVEIDHYTYVLRTKGLTLYGGVDCFRDSFGEMQPVMETIREKYRPQVAFLPISKAVFDYRYGGANGFCRYLDEKLLGQSFQYTAGPEDVAEWVATLGARFVVPYAIFTFSRWTTPPAVAAFRKALRSRGLEQWLYPLRPLDSLPAPALHRAFGLRRRALATWFHVGALASSLDGRANASRAYRLVRRAAQRLLPA